MVPLCRAIRQSDDPARSIFRRREICPTANGELPSIIISHWQKRHLSRPPRLHFADADFRRSRNQPSRRYRIEPQLDRQALRFIERPIDIRHLIDFVPGALPLRRI